MVFYLPGFPQTTKTVARPEQTPVGKVAFFYLRTTFLHLYTTYLISICLYIYNICVYNAHLMYYLQTLSLSLYIYIYTYSTYHPPIWDSLEHSKYLRTTYIFTYLVYPLYITYIYIYTYPAYVTHWLHNPWPLRIPWSLPETAMAGLAMASFTGANTGALNHPKYLGEPRVMAGNDQVDYIIN